MASGYECVRVRSVVSVSLRCHGLEPTRLCLWDFPGKNAGVVDVSFSRGSPDPGIEP